MFLEENRDVSFIVVYWFFKELFLMTERSSSYRKSPYGSFRRFMKTVPYFLGFICLLGVIILGLIAILVPQNSPDEIRNTSDRPTTWFMSLRSQIANVRTGPDQYYPIQWQFEQRGLPLLVIDTFGNWRQIRDWQGDEGWLFSSHLSTRRTVMVLDNQQTLYAAPDSNSRAIAHVEERVIGNLLSCSQEWCHVTIESYEGWIRRDGLWGTEE